MSTRTEQSGEHATKTSPKCAVQTKCELVRTRKHPLVFILSFEFLHGRTRSQVCQKRNRESKRNTLSLQAQEYIWDLCLPVGGFSKDSKRIVKTSYFCFPSLAKKLPLKKL
jgi:hypothetical protein